MFTEKSFIPKPTLALNMGRTSKGFSLLLFCILAVSSLLIIQCADAQSIPKPSVPDFTLRIVAHPYDVAQTTTVDPYTGKTITTEYGYHIENKSIEVTIKKPTVLLLQRF